MGLTKQAKTLCKSQVALLFTMLKGTRYPLRNRVIAQLSIKAGLRAKEIANPTQDRSRSWGLPGAGALPRRRLQVAAPHAACALHTSPSLGGCARGRGAAWRPDALSRIRRTRPAPQEHDTEKRLAKRNGRRRIWYRVQ